MSNIITNKQTNKSIVDLLANVNGQNRRILEVWTGTPEGNKQVYSDVNKFTIVNDGIVPKLITFSNKYLVLLPGETSSDIPENVTSIYIGSCISTGSEATSWITNFELKAGYKTISVKPLIHATAYKYELPENKDRTRLIITDTDYLFSISNNSYVSGKVTIKNSNNVTQDISEFNTAYYFSVPVSNTVLTFNNYSTSYVNAAYFNKKDDGTLENVYTAKQFDINNNQLDIVQGNKILNSIHLTYSEGSGGNSGEGSSDDSGGSSGDDSGGEHTHSWTDNGGSYYDGCIEYVHKVCSVCGAEQDLETGMTDHNYVKIQDISPTCTTPGYAYYSCTKCDASYSIETTSPYAHDVDEKTGICRICKQGGF